VAGSTLLLDEYFENQDPRFLDALLRASDSGKLASFADRWTADHRPWAREQMFAYLDEPLRHAGHHPVVKRLFKQAERVGDDELLAAFLVAFDRSVRREIRAVPQWDYATRRIRRVEKLITPQKAIPPQRIPREYRSSSRIVPYPALTEAPPDHRLFSARTRYYLRRRAWRHFRRMGYQRPDAYVEAICRALVLYRDDDLERGENILDSYALLRAFFEHHDAVSFGANHARLAPSQRIADLRPAPRFPELWQRSDAAERLLNVVSRGRARLVRAGAIDLLREHHAAFLAGLPSRTLLRLLDHDAEDVQAFGATLLESSEELGKLPIDEWLRLLTIRNPIALDAVCAAMEKHVRVERLDLEQCVAIATARSTSAARLGLRFLSAWPFSTPDRPNESERAILARLADTRSRAAGAELCTWALARIAFDESSYDADPVVGVLDALEPSVRRAAWDWLAGLETGASFGWNDPVLWSRLLETPFDDVRLRIVEALERRAKLPGTSPDDLAPLWTTVLLGVRRGGRQKLKAVRQLGAVLCADPSRADELLPVLAVALRSVRGPEFRAALAAIAGALERCPQLAPAVARCCPEVSFDVAPPALPSTASR